jgi:hypothetical protein
LASCSVSACARSARSATSAADPSLSEPVEERAAGFGIILMVVGAIAIAGSLLARRVDRLWYRKPPRWRMLHGEQTDWRKWWRP